MLPPQRWLRFASFLPLALALATGCATSSAPKERKRTVLLSEADAVSDEEAKRRRAVLSTQHDDARVGAEAAEQVAAEIGLLGDAELDAYVTRIGERLLRGMPRRGFSYEFAVVDQIEPNAFALPGGYIFISRGLLALADSEDELANVIGHEIIHAAHRHAAAQQALARAQNPLSLPWIRAAHLAAYGRDMERDADRGGQLLAAAAGYDPLGMSTFMAKLDLYTRLEAGTARGPSFFDTHPTTVERASVNAVRAAEIRWTRDPSLGDTQHSHLDQIEGLAVGPRPAAGVFDGGLFLHPDIGFQIHFPEGWRTQNTNRAVGAFSPRRDAVVYLTADLPPGELRELADEFVEKELQGRARIRDSKPVKLGTLDAWRVEVDAPSARGSTYVLSTLFAFRDATWRITGMTPTGLASRNRGRILATTRSFRPIDRTRAAKIQGTWLHVVTARANEDPAALAERTGSVWNAARTAVANGVDTNHRFAGGERVKIARTGAR